MNPDFHIRTDDGIERLVYGPWDRRGIMHGFTTSKHDFSNSAAVNMWEEFRRAFPGEDLLVAEQVHAADIVDLRDTNMQKKCLELTRTKNERLPFSADAIVAPLGLGTAIGVITADCGQLLVRGTSMVAAIHAGWRGLAGGVIERTLELFPNEPLEVIIGPAASGACYEVGPEVLEAIGAVSVVEVRDGKTFLDVAETGAAIVRRVRSTATVAVAEICTILDPQFHSHRRDAASAGRGVGLIFS